MSEEFLGNKRINRRPFFVRQSPPTKLLIRMGFHCSISSLPVRTTVEVVGTNSNNGKALICYTQIDTTRPCHVFIALISKKKNTTCKSFSTVLLPTAIAMLIVNEVGSIGTKGQLIRNFNFIPIQSTRKCSFAHKLSLLIFTMTSDLCWNA